MMMVAMNADAMMGMIVEGHATLSINMFID